MGNSAVNQQVKPVLQVKEIKDKYLQKNFESLSDFFKAQNQLLDFKFFDQTFTVAASNIKIAHGINGIPQDIIVSKIVGSGSVKFLHGLFDKTNIYLTVTGPCRVRFFVGSYWNNANVPSSATTDAEEFNSTLSTSSGTYLKDKIINNTYQALSTDDVIYANASAQGFTITLPKSASVPGKILTFQRQDNTLANLIKIVGENGYLTTINTIGETLQLHATSVGWKQLSRKTDTPIISAGPLILGGTTTPPAFGPVATNAVTWWRKGIFASINYVVNQTGAGLNGSGDHILPFPAGLNAISTYPTFTTNVNSDLSAAPTAQPALFPCNGTLGIGANSARSMNGNLAYLYTSNSFRLSNFSDSTAGVASNNWGSGYFTLNNTTLGLNITVTIPIQNWNQ